MKTRPIHSPCPQSAWRNICIAHFWRCLADRSWSFFLPLFLSKSCGSIRPTSVLNFVQQVSVALLSAPLAQCYRQAMLQNTFSSDKAFILATVTENAAVAIGGFLICVVSVSASQQLADDDIHVEDGDIKYVFCNSPYQSVPFLGGLCCMVLDAMFSSLLNMIVSKQWVALMFPDEKKLAQANATLARIDLAVAAGTPLIISFLLQTIGYEKVSFILVGQHLLGATFIIYNLRKAWDAYPPLLEPGSTNFDKDDTKTDESTKTEVSNMATIAALPVRSRFVVAAYTLLYFTVISPGAMLNSWMNSLTSHTDASTKSVLNESAIALFGASSNLTGALATFITPHLIVPRSNNLYQAGFFAQLLQALCVVSAFCCFLWLESHEMLDRLTLYMFLVFVGLSRIGLWSFDLIERQILQQDIPSQHQTVVFSLANSATQVASLLMTYLCYVFADRFGVLVALSTAAVSVATILLWIAQRVDPTKRQLSKQHAE